MENFFNLPKERQHTIIDAALLCFGTNGYKKTSAKDIADAAGISKSMVFHYFGTKRELYFYLIRFCGEALYGEMKEKFDPCITDFFDRIMMAATIELSVIQRHPSIFAFLNSVVFESDEEVRPDIQRMLEKGDGLRTHLALDGMDATKFKEGIDPKLVMNILIRMTEGFISEPSCRMGQDLEAFYKDFKDSIELFKRNFYKQEYLTQTEER